MSEAPQEKTAGITTKGPALTASKCAVNQFAEKRMDNKQRKKRAHRRNLRRSNTTG